MSVSCLPEILGNQEVRAWLRQSSRADSVYPSYLFAGPAGLGKQLTALWYGALLNCTDADPPCGKCPSCRKIAAGNHPDVLISQRQPDKASIGVAEVREGIGQASYRPYEGRYRVWIISDAERLTDEAQNSLLKTLEEPPGRLMIILVCANMGALLPTVVSRCRPLRFRPLECDDLVEILKERGEAPERATVLSRLCEGRIGEALSYHQQPSLWKLRERALELAAGLAGADLWGAIRTAQELESLRGDPPAPRQDAERVISSMTSYYRDLLLLAGGCREGVVNVHHLQQLENSLSRGGLDMARAGLERLEQARAQLRQNVGSRLLFQRLCLRLSKMD